MLYTRSCDEAATHMPYLSDVVKVTYLFRAKPIEMVACFWGDVGLARLNNFRIRLVTYCPGLNKDTAVFHPRLNRTRGVICSFCHSSVEDAYHFICVCSALQQVRDSWLSPVMYFPMFWVEPGLVTPPSISQTVSWHRPPIAVIFLVHLSSSPRGRLLFFSLLLVSQAKLGCEEAIKKKKGEGVAGGPVLVTLAEK